MGQVRTLPGFDHAVNSLKAFLLEQGRSDDLRWIFKEDLTWHDGKFFLRSPVPEENQSFAGQLYERGSEQGLGVMLDVFCLAAGTPYCYVWVPSDERDAELALLAGLKISVPFEPPIAQTISDKDEWNKHCSLGRKQGAHVWLERLPSRSL